MLEMTIENFMSDFGITAMATAKDEGLLSVQTCKDRILNLIDINIQNFKNNAWDNKNRMNKLLVDLPPKKNKTVFTVRVGGKRVYRCNCETLDLTHKINFLSKFYQAVSQGYLDQKIIDFCENQVKMAMKRKEELKERRKSKRSAERAMYKQKEAEAIKHLPHSV